ncbi:Uncharacterized protein TCM_014756 [Theobroma cacao]|uniref:Uncharacterized protein n=1 Tax=Theobroma cacao TaxID=3641 RepID=A0A061G0F4_THECC|nr:Uncharacterized protein TCM_014756 [Theobroma cacao]
MLAYDGRSYPFIPLVQNFNMPSAIRLRNYLLAQHRAPPRNYALRRRTASQSRVQAPRNDVLDVVPLSARVRIGPSSALGPQRWLHIPLQVQLGENEIPTLLVQQRRYHSQQRRNLNERERKINEGKIETLLMASRWLLLLW